MMQVGLSKISNSFGGSLVVLVEEKDVSERFWVDFRLLNKNIKEYDWALPIIDDILHR